MNTSYFVLHYLAYSIYLIPDDFSFSGWLHGEFSTRLTKLKLFSPDELRIVLKPSQNLCPDWNNEVSKSSYFALLYGDHEKIFGFIALGWDCVLRLEINLMAIEQ